MMTILGIAFLLLGVIGYIAVPLLIKRSRIVEEGSEEQRAYLEKTLEQEIHAIRMGDNNGMRESPL